MSRYGKTKVINNQTEFYSQLAEKRDLRSIVQLETVLIHNPEILERISLKTDTHIWKYGDRFYNLAHKYYNDASLWWIVAWYNGYPTEATVQIGDTLDIPLNLEEIIEALRL